MTSSVQVQQRCLLNLLKSVRPFIAFSLVFSISFLLRFFFYFSCFLSFRYGVSEDILFRFLVDLTDLISLSLIFFSFFFFFLSGTVLDTSPSIFTFVFVFFSFLNSSVFYQYKLMIFMLFWKNVKYLFLSQNFITSRKISC